MSLTFSFLFASFVVGFFLGPWNSREPTFVPASRRPRRTIADRARDYLGQLVLIAGLAIYWSWLLGYV